MNKQKFTEYISYLRTHPEAYVEMMTGQKISLWQKLIIRTLDKIERVKYKNCIILKNGSVIYCTSSKNVKRSNRSKLISFYCYGCKEVHEDYPINKVQFIGESYEICKESYDKLLEPFMNIESK
jgi:hypothetical protein